MKALLTDAMWNVAAVVALAVGLLVLAHLTGCGGMDPSCY